ncbi:MAG: hypothetical protein A4E45_01946 [Methanosaeta sp. PtaB.Bin039]|nr:MAG: hypothetical protein A4E45_01946 [Methanosaeta sp. PtaB.Bin039]HOT07682.1 DUF1890 domain-containing protein [Methanotrichaceae archaeon]HQF17517.1 DUF1890 domain-containing protein [Methanotrichaceae archaeon]HQI92078.1 DUF1890 domain-containing protein [Methanotrichaceae archaeon]HQJ29317.1 DUF1890 domain-containing protein [Methanotrichaceae archaeon]
MDENAPAGDKRVLLMMGCPEVPVQMSLVLYMASRMNASGYRVVVAGTSAALNLARISDPDRHYLKKLTDIDRIIADLAEKKQDFDLACSFAHNDAGITYAATVAALSEARIYVIVFGRNAEELAGQIEFECTRIVEKAVHNPMGLRKKVDEVFGWAASKS